MAESKGFFGFLRHFGVSESQIVADDVDSIQDEGSQETESPITPEMRQVFKEKLTLLLDNIGFPSDIEISDRDTPYISAVIVNEEDAGRIIGKDGATLDAIQTLITAIMMKRFQCSIRIRLDIQDYRRRRFGLIRSMAMRAAKEVMETRQSVVLPPMSSADRRIVHGLFKNHSHVQSSSDGKGRDRRVVLTHR